MVCRCVSQLGECESARGGVVCRCVSQLGECESAREVCGVSVCESARGV